MLYRKIGSSGVEASILGFGCMRLPVIGGKAQNIDYEAATAMLHHAIESGVNYVDTAWFYHSEQFGQPGQSEPFVGEALSGGWRDRVQLATKLPQQLINERGEMDRFLERQLERLKTDHVDFYLVHMSLEEREIFPLAESVLHARDWEELDVEFGTSGDPLTGAEPDADYAALFARIRPHLGATG